MLLDRLKKYLSEQLEADPSLMNENTDIIQDLGADSLDLVELLSALEDEYDIMIVTDDKDELAQLTTVGAIIRYIEENA